MSINYSAEQIEELYDGRLIGQRRPFTRSYLIPVGDLNLDERRMMRRAADLKLLEAAIRLKMRDDPLDLIIRDCLPNTDLALAATDDWLIAGAGVAGTELQYFSHVQATDSAIVFYGLGVETATKDLSRLKITLATAQTRGAYQLEQLYSRLEPAGYFSNAIVFIRNDTVRAAVMPRTAFAANYERLHLFARVCEPYGAVISAPAV